MYRIIILLAFATTLSSCFEERIELDYNTDENKKLVITGWITDLDEPQIIQITRTINYLGDEAVEGVRGAEVSLKDATTTYELTEKTNGNYYLPDTWTARIGDTYELRVVHEGKEYTAQETMRPCPTIEGLTYQEANKAQEGDSTKIYETIFGFQDIIGEGDGYFGVDYLKGFSFGDTITNGGFTDDEFIDGEYFDGIVITESDRQYAVGDSVMVELHSIGKETADFLEEIENEIFRGGPFDAPPANVRTNITGGAVGYFIISDTEKREIVIE